MGFLGKNGMMARRSKALNPDDSQDSKDTTTGSDIEEQLNPPDPDENDELSGFPGDEDGRESSLQDAEPDSPSNAAALDEADLPPSGPGELPTDLGLGIDANPGPDPAQAPPVPAGDGQVPDANPAAPPVPPGVSPASPAPAPGIETDALGQARRLAAQMIAQKAGGMQ